MEDLGYRLGGLLYMPAVQDNIVKKILHGQIPCLSSIAFCLEDAIRDNALHEAEDRLLESLSKLQKENFEAIPLPPLFIRIRNPEHMKTFSDKCKPFRKIITGYILPKFDLSNSSSYLRTLEKMEFGGQKSTKIMPILESFMIANPLHRLEQLMKLKEQLDQIHDCVLNVRVGANDLCNIYGVRCPINHTIYDVGCVKNALVDIVSVFGNDYIVSGPVWNYFGNNDSEPWAQGLRKEIELDRMNGFIGKTAIHPAQLPIIHEEMKVLREDYEDACSILDWKSSTGVEKGIHGTRMNEVKCHEKWAKRTKLLADIYGIKE